MLAMQRVPRYIVGTLFFGVFLLGGLYAGYSVATQLPLVVAT